MEIARCLNRPIQFIIAEISVSADASEFAFSTTGGVSIIGSSGPRAFYVERQPWV
jgi:hypothetical protein